MVLDIGRALRTGLEELGSETGLVVVAVVLVFQLGYGAVVDSLRHQLAVIVAPAGPSGGVGVVTGCGWSPLAAETSLPVLATLALAGVVCNEVIRFWAIRCFADASATRVADAGQRLRALVVLGGGFALLLFGLQHVVPMLGLVWGVETMGAFARTSVVLSMLFVGVAVYLRQEIALNDGSLRRTVRNSVVRFLQEPVPILGLLVLLSAVGFAAGIPRALTVMLDAGTVFGVSLGMAAHFVGVALTAVVQTLSIAAITDAYLQVRTDAGAL
jgi:hypothetical protein